jgi:hypothetical protein
MRRTSLLISSIVILAFALSGCAAGLNAETRNITRVTDGNEITIDENGSEIRVVNLKLVDTGDGAAVVVGTIINQGSDPDQLLGLSVNGVQATLTGETNLLTNKPITFEGEQANAKAVFYDVNPKAGTNVKISLGFAKAGLVSAEVIIRDKRDDFKNVISGSKLLTVDTATATE